MCSTQKQAFVNGNLTGSTVDQNIEVMSSPLQKSCIKKVKLVAAFCFVLFFPADDDSTGLNNITSSRHWIGDIDKNAHGSEDDRLWLDLANDWSLSPRKFAKCRAVGQNQSVWFNSYNGQC